MIYIDSRIGSVELNGMFEKGLNTKLTMLSYGDLYFVGRGPEEIPVLIGFERKKIKDLVNCMTTGRFAGYQLPGLMNSYNITYLVVEGPWRRNVHTGSLEIPNGKEWKELQLGKRIFQVRDVIKYLNTLLINCNLNSIKLIYLSTFNDKETVNVITDIYKWWTCKDFEEHRSHLSYFRPGISTDHSINSLAGYNPFSDLIEQESRLNPVKRAAEAIGYTIGVGSKKALSIASHFKSVYEMVLAPLEEWMAIKGIGKILAKRMHEEIHKEMRVE